MPHCFATSAIVAQAIPPGTSFLAWMAGALNSLSSLMVLVSGLLMFGGACYLVATRRRPSVLAAYLVLLPLPVLIALCGWMNAMIASLTVIASSPNLIVTTADIAEGTAISLLGVLVALLVSAPTYFVLAIGLLVRTLRPPTDSAAPTPMHSEHREPLLSSAGPIPAAT